MFIVKPKSSKADVVLEVDNGQSLQGFKCMLEKEPTAMKTVGRNVDNTLLLLKVGAMDGEAILA